MNGIHFITILQGWRGITRLLQYHLSSYIWYDLFRIGQTIGHFRMEYIQSLYNGRADEPIVHHDPMVLPRVAEGFQFLNLGINFCVTNHSGYHFKAISFQIIKFPFPNTKGAELSYYRNIR